MRILLNLVPVFRGGGLQNGLNLWRTVSRRGDGDSWLAVAREGLGFAAETASPWQELREVPPLGLPARLWWDNRSLPALAKAWGADVIFTPMGAGPLRSPCPTVVGWHDSTAAYPESEFWERISTRDRRAIRLRARLARRAVRRADRVCVQTKVMAQRLGRIWDIPSDRFVIVPNGPSQFLTDEAPRSRGPLGQPWRVLCIGEPKPTKNLEIVPEVAARLKDHMEDLGPGEFIMTFASDHERYLDPFRRALEEWGETYPIRRSGQVPHGTLGKLYREADAVFLPSLLESFSATYVEAMHFGVPLVTSGRDFAREICGDAAEYVDPLDAGDCARGLARVMTDSLRRDELRSAGFRRVTTFPSWDERFERYRRACYAVAGVGSAPERSS